MKNLATLIGALALAAGAAQAGGLNETNRHNDMPATPVTAQNPVQVKAAQVLSGKELSRRGLSADADLWSCPHFTGHSGCCGLSCNELAGRAHLQP